AQHLEHVGVGDVHDGLAGVVDVDAERLCKLLLDRAPRAGEVELHLAAEKPVARNAPKQQVRIRDGDVLAAKSVSDGSRIGTCASGADLEHAVVEPGDGAAAGAD